tara:strand:+ start:861 stop:1037 length:177 start_codon:yes stop_codon:yes gene_type:complete
MQMNYNMCNKQRREQGRSTEQQIDTPPAMKYYYVTRINAYMPINKLAQGGLISDGKRL